MKRAAGGRIGRIANFAGGRTGLVAQPRIGF
ncbi:MAG: hypothetical protein QOH67_4880, partial [Hyphomicrobiales bacterium]|nr:hypothetical protein [Hyphomicrobiales bacterium]